VTFRGRITLLTAGAVAAAIVLLSGLTWVIVRAELPDAARRLVLFGRNVGPQEALALRIFDELQPPEVVLARALAVAEEAALPRQAFVRIKGQLRGPALARIALALAEGDPLAGAWLSEEAQTAAAAMLARR